MDFENMLLNLSFTNLIWQITTPLLFSLADIITGYIQALINKSLDSKKMRVGLLRKCLLVIILLLSNVIQFAFNLPFISTTISIYIIFMEVVSIIENLTQAGIDLGKLADILKIKGDK